MIENLSPGYFALVMATGIVSIAAHFLDLEPVSGALFWFNVAGFVVLLLLTLVRLTVRPWKVLADLGDHARGPGFFTLAAGTCVLGTQFVILRGDVRIASVLWLGGIAAWAVVTYGFFAAVTTRSPKPLLGDGLNGTWLIAVVSMQSISVLGCLVAPVFDAPEPVLLIAAGMHLGGFMLYLPLIGLLLYRWMFVEFSPQQLTPPYWINMGALAISTLAGSRLLQATPSLPFLRRISPFLEGMTFFYWTAATWWIPLLFLLGFWRHVVRRVAFQYDPQYWGLVFPLGMYTTCTVQISRALDLPELMPIARVFVWPALIAWACVTWGLVVTIARGARSLSRSS